MRSTRALAAIEFAGREKFFCNFFERSLKLFRVLILILLPDLFTIAISGVSVRVWTFLRLFDATDVIDVAVGRRRIDLVDDTGRVAVLRLRHARLVGANGRAEAVLVG